MSELSPGVKKAIKRFQQKRAAVKAGIVVPRELDVIADVVLAYRPKPKTKAAKKRARRAKKNVRTGN